MFVLVTIRKLLPLVVTLLLYVDIDECTTGIHNCTQRCVNTPGGYDCECFSGYEMIAAICEGK